MSEKNQPATPAHDPLFTLKHAEAEAALGPIASPQPTDEYATDADTDDLDEGPRDSQGQRCGETDPTDQGSHAGKH